MKDKKITLATFKSFLKKNEGKLFIKVNSEFNGMTDCIETTRDDIFEPIKTNDRANKNNLGYAGLWLVLNSRDYFTYYEDDKYIGIEVYNCCGSSTIAIIKEV